MNATLAEFANAQQGFSLISNRKLLALYHAMELCRQSAERTQAGKPSAGAKSSAKAVSAHASRGAVRVFGYEAAVVGATIDLLAGDTVAPLLLPEGILDTFNPVVKLEPSVRESIRAAAATPGAGVTVLFSRGNGERQTRWQAALEEAVEKKLPILFVSLANQEPSHGLSKFLSTTHAGDLVKLGRSAVPWIAVDRHDVVAIYRVASESMVHARKGHGPTVIECGASFSHDALETMRSYLVKKGLSESEIGA